MERGLTEEQIEAQAGPPRRADGGARLPRRRRNGPLATYLTPKEPIPAALTIILGILGFAIPLLIWAILTYGNLIDPYFLPSPSSVVGMLWTMLTQDAFIADIWASTYRIFLGFILSAIVGVPLGILIGSFRAVQAFLEPPFSFARYLPASAFIPLLIVWLGIEESEKVTVIIIGSFFQLTLLVADISAGIQKELLNIAYTLGATRRQVFLRVLIPASLPGVVDTLRIIIGWAWTYLIVAEIVSAQTGIGHVILEASRFDDTQRIIAGILSIGILGLITDGVFRALHTLLFPYAERVAR